MSKGKLNKPLNVFLAASLVSSIVVPAASPVAAAGNTTTDLIISEYIEGSSSNKAIELYNGTGSDIDLSAYTLELYSNGAAAASQSLDLSGNLKNGETYVLFNGRANDDIKSKGNLEDSSVINFNGDDAIVLKKTGNVIDSIGQVGERIENMKDVTLVRNSDVLIGDTVIYDQFDPTSEWTALPKDDSSNLGFHSLGEGDPVTPPDEEEPVAEVISIAEARALELGQIVTIKGVVAADLKNTISVQDETGGIAVRPTSLNISVGDEVVLTGTLADYRGLLQLDGATVVEKTDNAGAPRPLEVTGADVAEENESKLVTVKNIELTDVQDGGSWANFTATDGETEFIIRDEKNELGLSVGNTYESITGIVQQFDDDYQIIPRSTQDIVVDSSVIQSVVANPGSGKFVGSTTVKLSTNTANAVIYYTLDGTEPTAESGDIYKEHFTITEDTTVKAKVVTEDGREGEVETFQYEIIDELHIHDIQGDGHHSPFDGQFVQDLKGIVTYTFELNGSTYYHIQTPDEWADDNPNTSEGVILYSGKNAWGVNVGDLVAVTGEVDEYAIDGFNDREQTDLKLTQINVRDDKGGKVEVVEEDVELPKPIVIDENNFTATVIDNDGLTEFDPEEDAIDFWESLEGMRVEVGNVKAVAPQEHGDLITVLENRETDTLNGGVLLEEDNANPDRIQFRMEPNGPARDFEVATGDTFTGPITGVVGYSFQNYKINVPLETMEEAHTRGEAIPEKTSIVKDDAKLTIASYNLENFSNNKSETSDDRARKLARAFAQDMQSPDIIGVTEVQDNNGQDKGDSAANESYERLIAEIEKAGGEKYEYVNIDPVNNEDGGAPNANIRVGFLYNPERVSLTEDIPAGDATTAVGYEDGKLTLNPGRIDPNNEAFDSSRKPLAAQFDFQGESVVVIANHWNSKSGDTPLFGSTQPPVYGSEEQRHKIAKVVADFIDDIKTKDPNANIVSLGDFNDFQFSETLKIHEGEHMTNMIHEVEKSDRYTYLYQGNSQVLDHILVSNNLAQSTEVDILHINADFTDMAGRASDHDPVMVQVDLAKTVAQQPPFFQYKEDKLKVTQIAQYDSGAGEGGTEILAYDADSNLAFVTNGAKSGMDILSFDGLKSGDFKSIKSKKHVSLQDLEIANVDDITSVAVSPTQGLVALSVVSNPKTDPGYIVLLTKAGEFVEKIQVGSLPDMVTFTHDGKKILVANEGEPSDDYTVNPNGSISIIDVGTKAVKNLSFEGVSLDENVRVSSKGSVLEQLEPEYITVSEDSKRAYVSMQENNAIATIDLENDSIIDVKGLGVKDHSAAGNELDGKRDDQTKIEKLPLLGFYMPDAIDTFTVGGKTYIVTPNEGDARDYDAYSEEASIGDIADQIQLNADNYEGYTQEELDQLVADGLLEEMAKTNITLENGFNEDSEKYEALYSYGGRSFSIFDAETMELVYDSGSEFERVVAEALPEHFNTNNDELAYDKRSSSKGPEPETVVTGVIDGKTYAFIALERTSAIMVYDLTNPAKPEFVTLISSRDFSADVKGDVSPEGLQFIPADVSPTGKSLLAATHEISGTVAVYEFSSVADEVEEEVAEKSYTINNFKTKQLTLSSPSISVHLNDNVEIAEGVTITSSEYVELSGEGFVNLTVTIEPEKPGAIIDFKGTNIKEVIIDMENIAEIRGAENIQDLQKMNN